MKKRKLAKLLFEVYGNKGEVVDLYEWAISKYERFPKKDKVEFDYDDIYEEEYRIGCEEMKKLSNTEEHLWTDLMKRVRQ